MATEKLLIDLLGVNMNEVDTSDCTDVEDILSAVITYLSEQPTVDAVEVVHGRWIPTYHTYYNRDGASQIADEWHCSVCDIYSRHESNYCPNCGAKMDLEVE